MYIIIYLYLFFFFLSKLRKWLDSKITYERMESIHWEIRDLRSLFVKVSDGLGRWLLRAQQHYVFIAVHKQFAPARAGRGLSSTYCPAARAFCCSNAALCSIMALIMVGLIAGLIAGDMGRSGYWLDFELIKTHWKYGILPVIQSTNDYSGLR